MATRLYLRDMASGQAGRPIGTAATTPDAGHAGPSRLIALTMSATVSPGPHGDAYWVCGSGALPHYDLARIWLSPALAAQTLEAGQSFTIAFAIDQETTETSGVNAAAFAYLWRPGVGYVATISDADPTSRDVVIGGDEMEGGAVWREMTATLGQDIEVKLRDRLVCEAWLKKTDHLDKGNSICWNGTHIYSEGQGYAEDAASCLTYSGDLLLAEEMTMNSLNILVGARDLEVDGVNVGALEGGVTVTYEPTHVEHTVDQRMGIQRVDKITERMTITASLKEATLENLRIAWGQPTYALSTAGTKTTLHLGGDDAVAEHTLVITGKAPGTNRTRTITCHKAVAIETSAHTYSKDGTTVYPVTFVLVEDPGKGAGYKYMTVEDDEGQFTFA